MVATVVGSVVAVLALATHAAFPQAAALPFTCDVFTPDLTADDLVKRFGADNVKAARVPWGGAEGEFNDGTVLFDGQPEARLEIYWRDAKAQRHPQWVSVRGARSRWQSRTGLTLGLRLKAIEVLNGRPFRLLGFGHDNGGALRRWAGGHLEAENVSRCSVGIRLSPDWDSLDGPARRQTGQLRGEGEFSSGHPAMQSLNPSVSELVLMTRQ